MNDGKISLPPSALSRVMTSDVNTAVKILSAPPNMPTDKPIQGEVVSHEKNIIVLKTEQGLVALETRQASMAQIRPGDVVQIRVQQTAQLTAQNVQNAMMLDILSVNGKDIKNAATSQAGYLTGSAASKPETGAATTLDRVTLPQQNMFQAYESLQAKLLGLPQALDDDAIAMVMKTLLRLPVQDRLPPSLQEGFDKFLLLTGLLKQANLLPEQQLQAGQQDKNIPAGLLTSLQNILQNDKAAQNPLLQNMPQQFIQLQTVLPGDKLSPNILVDIRQQLVTILAQSNNTMTGHAAALNNAPQGAYTMPAIGMVIGMPNTQNPLLQQSNLVFMTTPDGQNLMGVLTSSASSALSTASSLTSDIQAKPLLPGTVFVLAFQPQADKTLSIPMIPLQILTEGMDGLQPLHLTLGDTWPALDELWQSALVQQMANPDALAILRQTIPTPHAQQFPPALLFFIAALKNGMFENWVAPDKLAGLEKLDTIRQMLSDMRGIQSQLADDGNPDSWKALPVPMQLGDQLVRLQFFYRHPDYQFHDAQSDNAEQEKQQKTRFVLNIPHTYLGDLQIDGLVQYKDLEMILRTERALPSNIEQDIRTRYQSVLETTGMHGSIHFQSGRDHYIRV